VIESSAVKLMSECILERVFVIRLKDFENIENERESLKRNYFKSRLAHFVIHQNSDESFENSD